MGEEVEVELERDVSLRFILLFFFSDSILSRFREITAITARTSRQDKLTAKLKLVIQHQHGTEESLPLETSGQEALCRTKTYVCHTHP